jgi:peptidoglycan/LPS O-acetylase OafA/YrhL
MAHTSNRSEELDLLRALAIMMVMVHHLGRGVLKGFLPGLLIEGWTGVDLFFLISGYLVTRSFASWLENAGADADFKTRAQLALKYCMRRLIRILPPAWFWAFVPMVGSLYFNQGGGFGPFPEVFSEFLAVLRFQYNYFAVSTGIGHISYFWSLAVEEHYYLFLPLFFLMIPSRNLRLTGLVLIALLCLLNRIIAWKSGTGFGAVSFLTHFRVDALALGSIVGLLSAEIKEWSNGVETKSNLSLGLRLTALLAIVYLWIAPSLLSRVGVVYYGYWTFALASAFLVASASLGKRIIPCPGLIRPSIAAIGRRSYTLYLIHLPILISIREVRFRLFGIAPSETWDSWGPAAIELSIFLVLLAVLTELNFQLLESPLIEIAKTRFGEFRPVFESISLRSKADVRKVEL